MLNYFKKFFESSKGYSKSSNQKNSKNNSKNGSKSTSPYEALDNNQSAAIQRNLDINVKNMKNVLKTSSDIIYHEFEDAANHKGLVVYIKGFVETEILNRDILAPLMQNNIQDDVKKLLYITEMEITSSLQEAVMGVIEGNVVLVVDGHEQAFILAIKKKVERSIEEPNSESVVRGPKEGFVESLKTNLVLLRRKIRSPHLMIETLRIGRVTQTEIAVAYIENIVNPTVLQEVKSRLTKIDVDSILESGYIEEYIQDTRFSPYPLVGNSQKPDIVAGKMLEGRVAIVCDGTPHVLTVPYLYIESLQTGEDYYVKTLFGSFLRMLRLVGLTVSTLLPALYVALVSYHHEMLPNVLLISIAGAREGIPLPAFAEALIMGIMFELLKESGTRLPRAIGSAISIVGALVIGEAAVNAGLVSAPMVIITAVTAVSGFILPSLTEAMTIFRLIFLLLAGIMGLVGITAGIFFVMMYTVSLRSFGVPYTASISSETTGNMKDVFVRPPLEFMKERPSFLVGKNKKRRGGK